MLGIFAAVQDAAVDFGMKSLDAAVEHFGKPCEFGDVFDGDAGIAQQFGGASGGDEFDAKRGELAGEIEQSGLVGDTENGALDAGRHAEPRRRKWMIMATKNSISNGSREWRIPRLRCGSSVC